MHFPRLRASCSHSACSPPLHLVRPWHRGTLSPLLQRGRCQRQHHEGNVHARPSTLRTHRWVGLLVQGGQPRLERRLFWARLPPFTLPFQGLGSPRRAQGPVGGRRPSSDDRFHGPSVIPPSALAEYNEELPLSMNVQSRLTSSFADDGNASYTVFVKCRWWNDGWTVKTVVT